MQCSIRSTACQKVSTNFQKTFRLVFSFRDKNKRKHDRIVRNATYHRKLTHLMVEKSIPKVSFISNEKRSLS